MADARPAPRPVAQGTLEEKPLVHLLVYLDKKRITGTLALFSDTAGPDGGSGQDRVYFVEGRPVAAQLAQPSDSLEQGLLSLFDRERASFGFYEADLLGSGPSRLEGEIDPLALIARSLRRTAREEAVRSVLNRIGSCTLRLSPGAQLQRLQLQPKERALVESLQAEPSDAATLIRSTDLPQETAERFIYLLAITTSVAIYEQDSSAQASAEATDRSPSVGPKDPDAPQPTPARTVPAASESAKPAIREQAPAAGQAATVAPLGARATEVISTSGAAADQRQRPTASQPATGPVESIPSPPRDLNAEMSMRWMDIINRSGDIENLTYFQMLNVSRDAAPDQVKAAYFELAKLWHPDRLPTELLPLKERVQVVFHHMSQAHEHLTDKEKRIEYLKSVDEGGGTVAADRELKHKLDAALQFVKVDVLIKRHCFDQALELVDQVLQVDDGEASYHATRALVLMNRHLSKDAPFAEMLRSIDRALELDPNYEDALYYRGQVLRRMGRADEAIKEFRRVLAINPGNVAAQREVRVHRIRRNSSQAKRKSSLMSLVFGKKSK